MPSIISLDSEPKKLDNLIVVLLKKYPELRPLYKKERELRSRGGNKNPMRVSYFFTFVVARTIQIAFSEKNMLFIQNIFQEMEILLTENRAIYLDIIITGVYESIDEDLIKAEFLPYFGKELKEAWRLFTES